MSNHTNEVISEQKYEAYHEYLVDLDEEFLLYEFTDRTGTNPEGYYTNSINAERSDKWIETLLDLFGVELSKDLDLIWINPEYEKQSAYKKKVEAGPKVTLYCDLCGEGFETPYEDKFPRCANCIKETK
jgi:hypothetical protein